MSYLNQNENFSPRFQSPYDGYWNQPPHYDIVKVNGENGAQAFRMGPNSRILLLDENEPIIWFVQTDGAGYKTITPYDFALHVPKPQVNINDLEARIASLEERLNAKSNTGTNNKNTKRQQPVAAANPVLEQS